MPKRSLLVLVLLIAAACTTKSRGLDRGALSALLAPSQRATDEEIQRVLELEPQLPQPFSLGVYVKSPPYQGWTWDGADKQKILDLGTRLEKDGVVSETVFISSGIAATTKKEDEIEEIRLAAARHGVDAVLVVSGAGDVERELNPLGWTYILLVTPLFVPGTDVDGLFVAHAAMWDVRNGYLYTSVETDGAVSQSRPAFLVDDHEVRDLARTRALDALVAGLKERIERLAKRNGASPADSAGTSR